MCVWHAGKVASNFTSIAHTGITVASLGEALAFWVDVLGFTLERRFHLDGEFAEHVTGVESAALDAAVLTLGGQSVELLEYSSPMDRSVLRPRPCDVGSVHLAFNVSSMDEAVSAARSAGWDPVGEPMTMTEGSRAGTAFVYLTDHQGGTLEFIQAP
jgi:catechol 2,3-dioxygenase-like lactoylglutathione lyase family enzyme